MTILISCLVIVILLPFIAKIPVAMAMHQLGGYDNNHPRAQQAKLTGFGARALAGHQNAFESLIIFAPAVLLAIATRNIGETMQYLAIIHVASRVLYHIFYLIDLSTLRSVVWVAGLASAITMMVKCLP